MQESQGCTLCDWYQVCLHTRLCAQHDAARMDANLQQLVGNISPVCCIRNWYGAVTYMSVCMRVCVSYK